MIKKRSESENKGIVPTEMELVLEQTQQGKLGDSDVHTLEDTTLILEIMLRRFFLRLNLPDHSICFKASATLISKSSRSDHVKELQERRIIKLSPSRKRFGILCSIVRSGLVYCSGGLSGKYTVLAVCQIVHCASGLSFLTAVCLIRQRFLKTISHSDLGNKPLPILFLGSGLVFLLHSGLPLSSSSGLTVCLSRGLPSVAV
ncbi:hypothetical protein Tco_0838092 [Tanacetum coccineum]|uniref:Uncharacterized protein n=1 Tax=Tanacetum coccineum TaxID=301880 RepID=A0ABQ5ALV3_9ASTR